MCCILLSNFNGVTIKGANYGVVSLSFETTSKQEKCMHLLTEQPMSPVKVPRIDEAARRGRSICISSWRGFLLGARILKLPV